MADLCIHEVVRCTICHEPDTARDEPATDSHPFRARFAGTCRECGFDINAGDFLWYVDDQVFHVGCVREVRRG